MDELIQLGRSIAYKKGEVLVRPSDESGIFYCITSGMVRAYTIEESGEKNIQIINGPSELFPISWLIKKQLPNLYYEALSDCVVVRMHTDDATRLLESSAQVSFAMLKQIVSQFVAYKARVDNLEYKFARERIAYHLLFLARRFGTDEDGVITMNRFSQEEIGSATNVRREGVSRELKRFERLKYIEYTPGKLVLLDPAGLRLELAPKDVPLFIDDL